MGGIIKRTVYTVYKNHDHEGGSRIVDYEILVHMGHEGQTGPTQPHGPWRVQENSPTIWQQRKRVIEHQQQGVCVCNLSTSLNISNTN